MALRCVDASFVVAWLVPSQESDAVMKEWSGYALGRDEFVGPALLYPETISTVRRLTHRGLLTSDEGRELVADFLALGIPTLTPPGLYARAYALADRYNQPRVYDTCYLALADTLSCQLLTLDERFYNSVSADFSLVTLVA